MRTSKKKKLTVRRETLRTIAAPQLAAVAGGDLESGVEIEVLPGDEPKPKTNAWTASEAYTVYDAQMLCTMRG